MYIREAGFFSIITVQSVMCANTVKPVCNDHLYDKIYYLWFIH